jgi:ankyrin repeat protein
MKTWLLVLGLLVAGCSPSAPPIATQAASGVSSEQKNAEAMAELKTYFFEAARTGDNVLIEKYVSSGFPVNVRTPQGYTALILAAYHGHKDTVQKLIQLGANPCARDNHGSTALMGATFKGELSIAKLLLDQPCSKVDDRNRDGQTAAMYAALAGNRQLVDMLRKRGANLNLKDDAGNTAAVLARQQGADELAREIERK